MMKKIFGIEISREPGVIGEIFLDKIPKILKIILESKISQAILAICVIYLGLGWLGIVGGWNNVGALFSKIGGVCFLVCGIINFIGLFKKNDT